MVSWNGATEADYSKYAPISSMNRTDFENLYIKNRQPLRSGMYYAPEGINGNSILTLNKVHYAPLLVSTTKVFDRLGAKINTGVATAVVRLGLYADSDGLPGSLILDAGTIDASVSSTVPLLTINQELSYGLYWIAAVGQVAAPNMQTLGGRNRLIGEFTPTVGGNTTGYTQTGVAGALPSVATPTALDYVVNTVIRAV